MNDFTIETRIEVKVKWKDAKGNKIERTKTEKDLQEVADFINEGLGKVILEALPNFLEVHS